VHPSYFRQGIARAMIGESFGIARKMGYNAVFLCGEPELYGKLGFVPSFKFGIFHVSDSSKNAKWCMVCELVEGALKDVAGTVDIV
jgi:predicted N-acetyltransferase YhbS